MLHDDVYKQFKQQFPHHSEKVIAWFPNGKNSVRVRCVDNSDLIFTYQGKDNWCFETAECFINRLIRKEGA